MAEAYPLHWPEGWRREMCSDVSKFNTSSTKAHALLLGEISRMGGEKVIISSNVPLAQNGRMRLDREPVDSGVAVYFTRKGKQVVFACDRFDVVRDNLLSIAKTIEALRGIERWGASDMMERAFTGFKALSANSGEGENPWMVLGLGDQRGKSTRTDIVSAHRSAAQSCHPDKGGSSDQMSRINMARDKCLREIGEVQ